MEKYYQEEQVKVECDVYITAHKNVNIEVDDYECVEYEDFDRDDDGSIVGKKVDEYFFTDCDIEKQYNQQHYTLCDLISELHARLDDEIDVLKNMIRDKQGNQAKNNIKLRNLQRMAKDCEGWSFNNFEYENVERA